MVILKESKIKQTMYDILIGKRVIKGNAFVLGGARGDKGETLEDLKLSALREYHESYVTTRLGYQTLVVAWLKVETEDLVKKLGFGRNGNSRNSKMKELDDFEKNRYNFGAEEDSGKYTGWVKGGSILTYYTLKEAAKDISEKALRPFLKQVIEDSKFI